METLVQDVNKMKACEFEKKAPRITMIKQIKKLPERR